MRDLFMHYGVTLAKRFTRKQKIMFINEISKDFMDMGYTAQIQARKQKFRAVTVNLHLGDVDNAEVIFLAPYDTGSVVMAKGYKYYPLNLEKTIKAERLSLTLGAFLPKFANRVNFNRNTASVILCREVARELKDKKKKAAFILLDKASCSYEGLIQARDWYKDEVVNKIFVFLECLAVGETIVLAHREDMTGKIDVFTNSELNIYPKLYSEEKVSHMALGIFPKLLHLVSGEVEDNEFVVKNTRTKMDYIVDIDRMEMIKKVLVDFVKSIR